MGSDAVFGLHFGNKLTLRPAPAQLPPELGLPFFDELAVRTGLARAGN
jgi:hypothetical protein